MKKLYFILTIILLAATNTLQAQNDSIYFWKSGAMIHRQSIKTVDLDSITFTAPDLNPTTSTLYALLNGNPNLSLFVRALERAGLTPTLIALLDSSPLTVFAPDNPAFIAAGFSNSVIDEWPISQIPALKEILLNHFLDGAFLSSSFTSGYVKTLGKGSASSTNTLSMYISTTSGVRLNGFIDVITADIQATNGIIHIVDAVVAPPTITTHLGINPNFSTLFSLLTRTGQPDFASVLSATSSSPFTVFAPTNSAFNSLDLELAPSGIAGVSANNITKILQYHIVAGANVLSSNLVNNQIITPILTPAQNFEILIFAATGASIKDSNNRVSPIIFTDIQCSNGVIHGLGKVLLPTF